MEKKNAQLKIKKLFCRANVEMYLKNWTLKIIFICTRSLTFNTSEVPSKFLKKKGYDVKVACSDTENLDFKQKIIIR